MTQYLHAVLEGAEVTDLGSENEVTKLCVREEDDEEHDGKTSYVFGALNRNRKWRKLSHYGAR